MKFRIIARHQWVAGAKITESISAADNAVRRFTATIRGWQNWKIYQGDTRSLYVLDWIIHTVRSIRERIDAGDETVFAEPNEYVTTIPLEWIEAEHMDALVAGTF